MLCSSLRPSDRVHGTVKAMSTKIYSGIRITSSPRTAANMVTLSTTIHRVVRRALVDVYERRVAAIATDVYDARTHNRTCTYLDVRPDNGSALHIATTYLHQVAARVAGTGRRNPEDDLSASLTLLPDSVTGNMYGLFSTEQESYRDALFASGYAHEYIYQNSTDDLPPGVSDTEWEEREQVWDRLLGSPGSTHGALGWTIGQGWDGLYDAEIAWQNDLDTLLTYQPSIRERARQLVEDDILNEYLHEHDPDGDPGTSIAHIMDARWAMNTPANPWHNKLEQAVAAQAAQLEPVTKEQLSEWKR